MTSFYLELKYAIFKSSLIIFIIQSLNEKLFNELEGGGIVYILEITEARCHIFEKKNINDLQRRCSST